MRHGAISGSGMGRFTSGSNTSGIRKKSICAACTGLRCGRIYILGLALKELIGGRTAVLGPTYGKKASYCLWWMTAPHRVASSRTLSLLILMMTIRDYQLSRSSSRSSSSSSSSNSSSRSSSSTVVVIIIVVAIVVAVVVVAVVVAVVVV